MCSCASDVTRALRCRSSLQTYRQHFHIHKGVAVAQWHKAAILVGHALASSTPACELHGLYQPNRKWKPHSAAQTTFSTLNASFTKAKRACFETAVAALPPPQQINNSQAASGAQPRAQISMIIGVPLPRQCNREAAPRKQADASDFSASSIT